MSSQISDPQLRAIQFELERQTEAVPLAQYIAEPIPSVTDEAVTKLLEALAGLPAEERTRYFEECGAKMGELWSIFSTRAASLAVRTRSPRWISRALFALMLDGAERDDRARLMDLAPIYDASLQLEHQPNRLVQEALVFVQNRHMQDILKLFLERRPEDNTLQALGYRTIQGADGFRYEPDLD